MCFASRRQIVTFRRLIVAVATTKEQYPRIKEWSQKSPNPAYLIGTTGIVCGAGCMKQYGVCPSVCPSVRLPVCLSHSPVLSAGCGFAAVGPEGRIYRSIAAQQHRAAALSETANAGSATFSACVGSAEHRLVSVTAMLSRTPYTSGSFFYSFIIFFAPRRIA